MEMTNYENMSKLIYFVDDDKMILNLLQYAFSSRDDFNIKTFCKGEDCLLELKKNIPDIIVLDHFFDRVDSKLTGMDTLKKIKEFKDIPVIMLSSQEKEDLIPEFIKNGASSYIKKDSFFVDTLLEKIDKIVRN